MTPQSEDTSNTRAKNVASTDINCSIPVIGSPIDVQIIEKSFSNRAPFEVYNVVATVETRVRDAFWLQWTVKWYLGWN